VWEGITRSSTARITFSPERSASRKLKIRNGLIALFLSIPVLATYLHQIPARQTKNEECHQ
jgi:hypothetical protein